MPNVAIVIVNYNTRGLLAQCLQSVYAGKLGARQRRELESAPDFDDLMLLRDLDDAGRVPGATVPTVDEALDFLKQLERDNRGK